jgi:NodT family efflux transporter outer membrane factor (OMF) lipoprotein
LRPEAYNKYLFLLLITVILAITGGCTHSAVTPQATEPALPEAWQRGGAGGSVHLDWLLQFDDPTVTELVREAINSNYSLAQERARLAQAEQAVVISRANRFPELDVSLNGSRRSVEDAGGMRVATESFDVSADARWEVDLWGRLSKQQQAAQLAYASQQARLEFAERSVAADTSGLFFDVMEAQQLLEVAQRRLDNAIESHDIVASGYRQGLNDALDLYLARNQVERQQAGYAEQEQRLAETISSLQLVLARYPDGNMAIARQLPVIGEPIPVGLPSELLTRRSDLQEAWLILLSADASLAAAHKARFPSLSLVGGASLTSVQFSDLFDGDASTWSIVGGLSQPLFNAGRLKALEDQAYARVQQAEQAYLELVYRAFADVENAISRSSSLEERYESFLEAQRNSATALQLALEQYQRGLVPYTTVLESQRQAFDADATVVQLRNQLLQNRIDLYVALGGDFSTN